MSDDSDLPLFNDETGHSQARPAAVEKHKWKVLIVDDEQGVHDVTILALKRFQFQGRGIDFFHAYTAGQAREILEQNPDMAVALIDVVMETDDAGLKLVEFVRKQQKNFHIRLILRTGQPGVAPESTVIENYDINDYKDKTELTKQKLTTALFTALRSYRDIMALEQNRVGLEQVVSATSSIYSIHEMDKFVSGLLTQVISVISSSGDALCAKSSGFIVGSYDLDNPNIDHIIAGAGIYEGCENRKIADVVDEKILERIRHAVERKQHEYYEDGSVFYIHNNMDGHGIIYVTTPCLDNENHKRLIELFCSNIVIAYENVSLNKEIEDTQREIIFTLGTVAEFRSQETGEHVQRVAEYVEILARNLGLSESESDLVKMASPLHDLGKLAIPDAILNKPGKLTEEEFEVIKTHTTHGYEMLRHSKRPLLKCAAVIAQSHQEKWDGTGYPDGLVGEDIPLYGRLVAIADVFDALGSKRCYKDGWEVDRIIDYFKEQRGRHFDPQLVDILMDNLADFLAVRDKHLEFSL